MNHSATLSISAPALRATNKRAFARHYGEMVLVMFAGMVVLGGLTVLGLASPAAAWMPFRAGFTSASWDSG